MAWLVVVIVLFFVSVSLAANPQREQLVAMYFDKGYPYQVILLFLAAFHGIIMSMSTLKRILRKNKRRRRRKHSSLHHVGRYIMVSWRKGICITCSSELLYASSNLYIQTELEQSGCLLGYRSLWARLKHKYRVVIPRFVSTLET